MRRKILISLYKALLEKYDQPGKWPWFGTGKPHSSEEIAIGAILTQNTNWRNVEYALENLRKEKALSIKGVYELGKRNYKKLKGLILPSGFYNQKAERLFGFCKFIIENYGNLKNFFKLDTEHTRKILLSLKGIGEETADTILLYSGGKPVFVIDTFTRRFVKKYKLSKNFDYDFLQKLFSKNLPKDVKLYQDFHALIVKWGKDNSKRLG